MVFGGCVRLGGVWAGLLGGVCVRDGLGGWYAGGGGGVSVVRVRQVFLILSSIYGWHVCVGLGLVWGLGKLVVNAVRSNRFIYFKICVFVSR